MLSIQRATNDVTANYIYDQIAFSAKNLCLESGISTPSTSGQLSLTPKLGPYSRARSTRYSSLRMRLVARYVPVPASEYAAKDLIQRGVKMLFRKASSKQVNSMRNRILRMKLASSIPVSTVVQRSTILLRQMLQSVGLIESEWNSDHQTSFRTMRHLYFLRTWGLMVSNSLGRYNSFWSGACWLWAKQVYLVSRSVRKQQGLSLSRIYMLDINGHYQNSHSTSMIECIGQIEVSINQRFDHLAMLAVDSEQLLQLVRDEQRRRSLVRIFRMIKTREKARVINEQRILLQLEKFGRRMSKAEIMSCESMFANCINQYLNTDYEVRKSGEPVDLIELFIFYYTQINAKARVNQLKVTKNCGLFQEVNFLHQNLAFFLANLQQSMHFVYESEKAKFLALIKSQNRSLSPERRGEEDEDERFDVTGKAGTKTKRKLQLYCFQLSRLLSLESIYVNYFYFSNLDVQKRKKTLMANFLKRNLHIKRLIDDYSQYYGNYGEKMRKIREKEMN